MKFREKKYLYWSIFVFHKFQGDSSFLHKIPGYFQSSRSQNKFQAFQWFQGAIGTLIIGLKIIKNYLKFIDLTMTDILFYSHSTFKIAQVPQEVYIKARFLFDF